MFVFFVFFVVYFILFSFFLFFLSWKGCQLFAAAVVESVMEANGLGSVGLLPREESDLGPYRVQVGPLWTDFTAKKYTSFFIYAVPQLDTSCVLEKKI